LYLIVTAESGLSDYESAAIIGHYNGLSEKKKDLKVRGYSDDMLKHIKKQKKTLVESLGVRFNEDGIAYPYFNYAVTLYFAYKNSGVLPFAGSLVDQPAKIIEIFNLLDALSDEAQKRAAKEQERLNKQNGRNRR